MCDCLSGFSQFWYNEAIPGHLFITPAIWLERTVSYIVSEMQEEGFRACLEVVNRLFLSLVVFIAALPIALFTVVVGLPSKAIGYALLYEEEGVSTIPRIEVRDIPPNGNCAFEAFRVGMASLGSPLDIEDNAAFRKKTSQWIAEHVAIDPDLAKLVHESIEEYLEVKLEWLGLEEEQLTNFKGKSEEEIKKGDERLKALPEEQKMIREKIKQIQGKKEAENIPFLEEYLEAITSDTDTERVYASRAHYYAFSRMFSTRVNIEIYIEHEGSYNLVSETLTSEKGGATLRFLHTGGNHIDLLIFP